ncbi:hypothetical protein JXA85_01645 [Candidatus Woesearchaeota archaeon]|nr:hypothetical protein [Candidatus Woesearchaeota archaeon]
MQLRDGRFYFLALVLISAALSASFVQSADPVFTDLPNNFTLYEDQLFTYYVEATDSDGEYPLNFSDDSESILPVFYMHNYNDTSALINFTAVNNDSAVSYTITIIVKDAGTPIEGATRFVTFNITNTNDAPNITQYAPSNLTPAMYENDTIGFTFDYNASDDDLVHPNIDNLSNVYYKNSVNISINTTWLFVASYCEAGYHNITLVVSDLYNASDYVVWNVSVLNSNRIPVHNKTFENQTWPEDTNLVNILDLDEYFYDLDNMECTGQNNDSITYAAYGNSSIRIVINESTHNVSFIPTGNFTGAEVIYFEIFDGYNRTLGNNITLNVTPVNDVPVIQQIPDQTAYEYAPFSYQVNATDVDTYDSLYYYDNTSLFNISASGLISFSLSGGSAGNHTINITVGDGTLNASVLMNIEITNNNPPSIYPVENQTIYENSAFSVDVTAFDLQNHSINFSDDTAMFDIAALNATAGRIQFTPDNADVGNHTVTITATDEKGAPNTTIIYFTILDINNPPVLTSIGERTARINNTFTLLITATDADDDPLNFSSNSTLFNITYVDSATGMINFTPTDSQFGNYSINITVSDGIANDSEVINFFVIINSPPVMDSISNQSVTEDSAFVLTINSFDSDGDNLTYDTNSTLFTLTSVNSTAARINFTPDYTLVGNYTITVNVSDGYINGFDTAEFNLSIRFRNDPPYFTPPLTNWTAYDGTLFTKYVSAYDEENDTLSFGTNSSLFNFTVVNYSSVMVNFTPSLADRGNHTIIINVTDGTNVNTTTIVFFITSINNPPNITGYYPTSLSFSIYENSTQGMNISATDSDTLSYYWLVDGTVNGTTYNYTYSPDFSSAGTHNITAIASDGTTNSSLTWNVTVLNLNRPIIFGLREHKSYSDFISGTFNSTNLTLDGRIVLSRNGSAYITSGTYLSPVIDFQGENYLNVSLIEWSGTNTTGSNTTVLFQLRTAASQAGLGAWGANHSGQSFVPNVTPHRYLQYKMILETNNSTTTPDISNVKVHYTIGNLSYIEDSYLLWVDLDNFFYDLDTGDNLTYNYSTSVDISVTINNETNVVTLYSENPNTVTLTFSAYDGYNTTYSNNVTILFQASPAHTETAASSGGGGGSSVVTIMETKVINQTNLTKRVTIELISPGIVTLYKNETMEIPIRLVNNYEADLNKINLSILTNLSMNYSFKNNPLAKLEPGEEFETVLYINAGNNIYGLQEITVKAEAEQPEFADTAKIFINSLEKGLENVSQINTKITFTEDLFRENPECLELNEILTEAKKALQTNQFSKAQQLIDDALEGCKYIISQKDAYLELPESRANFFDKLTNSLASAFDSVKIFMLRFIQLIKDLLT